MNRPVGALSRRFATIVTVGAVPIVLLLGALAYYAYDVAFQSVLDLHRQGLVARQAGLAQIASAVRDQVAVTQAFLTRRLEEPLSAVTTSTARGGLAEDEDPGPARGAVVAPPGALDQPGARERLAAAESLFPLQRAVHETKPYLKWSYVFDAGRAFISLYPWNDITDLRDRARDARERRFQSWFDFSVFQYATPEQNPDHLSFWTAAYVDAGGSGPMITHGAPVYAGGAFAAVVASDVTLSYLTDYLQKFEPLPGRFVLIDETDSVIGNSDGHAASVVDGRLPRAETILGATPLSATQGVFGRTGAERYLSLFVPGTPWRLIHTVPYAALLRTALLQVVLYLLVAASTLLALVALYRILTAQFVWPALRLADYVQAATEATAARVPVPEVPKPWRPWVGRVVGALAEQNFLMDRLREAEGIKTAVIDSAIDAVVIADGAGTVIGFNPGAERIFGYPAETAFGRDVGDLLVPNTLSPAERDRVRRLVRGAEPQAIGQRQEIEARRADGASFPAEIAIVNVNVGGKTVVAAYIRDLTDQKAAAEAIKNQQQRINQIEKLSAMGSLLAGVAHELNNPLAILMAQATLLQDMDPPPAVKTRADRIYAAAQRSGRIVKSFLAMARQKPPVREPTQLNDVIAGALELTGYGLRSSGIEVVRDFAPDLPLLSGDPDLLGQVFTNLLINAQQILQDRPTPRCIHLATREEAGSIVADVCDNGPGVAPEIAARIFEPYFTTKPVGVGTGIGLSICRNVVEAHGGQLDLVASSEGAHFRITLPLRVVGSAAVPGGFAAQDGKLSVLIVDDEEDVAASLAEIVEALHHNVVVCDSAERGLDFVREEVFDIVFTDLRMPGMNGLEFRNALEAITPGMKARTVIVTGDTVLGAQAVKEDTGTLVLEKPFTSAEVRLMLSRVLVTPSPRA